MKVKSGQCGFSFWSTPPQNRPEPLGTAPNRPSNSLNNYLFLTFSDVKGRQCGFCFRRTPEINLRGGFGSSSGRFRGGFRGGVRGGVRGGFGAGSGRFRGGFGAVLGRFGRGGFGRERFQKGSRKVAAFRSEVPRKLNPTWSAFDLPKCQQQLIL